MARRRGSPSGHPTTSSCVTSAKARVACRVDHRCVSSSPRPTSDRCACCCTRARCRTSPGGRGRRSAPHDVWWSRMRPLSPLPIALGSAALAGVLWSSEALDDIVGAGVLVWISQMLVWLGIRGPTLEPSDGPRRALLAIGGAMPTVALWLALIPWVARGDGMDQLGAVVMMMIFGVPLGTLAFAIALWILGGRPRNRPIAPALAIVASTTALAWLLEVGWISRADRLPDLAMWLAFPGIASWWLVLPLADWFVSRRAA